MNVKLLRKIQKAILKEPRRFEMGEWGMRLELGDVPDRHMPPCKTLACIAGHADLLTHPRLFQRAVNDDDHNAIRVRAQEQLGLTDRQAEILFTEWDDAYDKLTTPLQRARWAVKRIDKFIRTNGAE